MPLPSATTRRDDRWRTLIERETALLEQALIAEPAGQWLLLDATTFEPPLPGRPWLHLRCDGDVHESLESAGAWRWPDARVDVIVLRHVVEFSAMPQAALEAALRALAPGGLLLITGLHPWSPWRPWLARRLARGGVSLRARAARHLSRCLLAAGGRVEDVQRFGSSWPGHGIATGGVLAAAYLLCARKQRSTPTAVGRYGVLRRVAVTGAPSLASVRWRQSA